IIFWWPIIDPMRVGQRVVTPLQKIAMLGIAGIPATVLGLLLALATAPLYPFYVVAPRVWGLSALTDQQIGGTIMFGVGHLIYFAAISLIFLRMFPSNTEA